jgi:hypothetical protein
MGSVRRSIRRNDIRDSNSHYAKAESDSQQLYVAGRIDQAIQKARERSSEAITNHQPTRQTPMNLNNVLEDLTQQTTGKEDPEMKKTQAELTRPIGAVLNLMDSDMMKVVFRSDDRKEVWQELNTAADHLWRVAR